MEIQELIFFHLHEITNKVEVQFRFNVDSDEELRIDFIELSEVSDFGYEIIMEDYGSQDDEDDDEEDDERPPPPPEFPSPPASDSVHV